jgi:hypothetical protein
MESSATPHLSKPEEDDLPDLPADMGELRKSQRVMESAIRFLGSCFYGLAGVTALVGLLWLADTFRTTNNGGLVPLFERFARTFLPAKGKNGIPWLLVVVAPPILFTVLLSWLMFKTGSGLRRP